MSIFRYTPRVIWFGICKHLFCYVPKLIRWWAFLHSQLGDDISERINTTNWVMNMLVEPLNSTHGQCEGISHSGCPCTHGHVIHPYHPLVKRADAQFVTNDPTGISQYEIEELKVWNIPCPLSNWIVDKKRPILRDVIMLYYSFQPLTSNSLWII